MRASCRSIGAALLRTSPPRSPSVVDDASSNCSLADAAHEQLMPGTAAAMPGDAGNLGLMHGENHRRGGAGAAERVTNIDDIGDACALAAELARHRELKQTLGARSRDGLGRKSRVAIDGRGIFARRSPRPFRRGRPDFLTASRVARRFAPGHTAWTSPPHRFRRSWMHSQLPHRSIASRSRLPIRREVLPKRAKHWAID